MELPSRIGRHGKRSRNQGAGPHDLPSLLALYRQLNPIDPPIDPQEATAIFDRFTRYSGSAILVGFKAAALVTTCALVVIPNLTRAGSPYALIENVVTDARHRKRGYGRAILEAAIAAAWRCGCYKVMLLTGSKDPATLSFYRGAGFDQSKTEYQIRRASEFRGA